MIRELVEEILESSEHDLVVRKVYNLLASHNSAIKYNDIHELLVPTQDVNSYHASVLRTATEAGYKRGGTWEENVAFFTKAGLTKSDYDRFIHYKKLDLV